MSGTALFWLAPCLPLVAFALLAVGLSRFGRLASGLAVAAMAGASIVSVFGWPVERNPGGACADLAAVALHWRAPTHAGFVA
jgi:hypothetical protein